MPKGPKFVLAGVQGQDNGVQEYLPEVAPARLDQ